jgi:hypothetical protein
MVVGGDLRKAIKDCQDQEKIILADSVVEEARQELMKDRTMQQLLSSCK